MPKGKTPSLIGSSLGRPSAVFAGRLCACSRCKAGIAKGDRCYDVRQPTAKFSSSRRFCQTCFAKVLEQTRNDLAIMEAL
jgi:hypothetical protein